MSLNWNITECADVDSIKAEDEWFMTEAIIFATMGVGMGRITADNAAEFYARCAFMESVIGPMCHRYTTNDDGTEKVTPGIQPLDVQRRIGLSTNVAPETRAKFIKRWADRTISDNVAAYNRAVAALTTTDKA